jgi:hypothetical protein
MIKTNPANTEHAKRARAMTLDKTAKPGRRGWTTATLAKPDPQDKE